MKRWLILLLIFLFLFLACVYIAIPQTLTISKVTVINCPKNAAGRFILDEKKWLSWWPQNAINTNISLTASKKLFTYKGYSFQIIEFFSDKVIVLASDGHDTITTAINIVPFNKNSIALQWECSLRTSLNPFKRIASYRQAKIVRSNMASISFHLKAFLEKTSNVYGFLIKEIISTDSTLIAIKKASTEYPGTDQIYDLIDTLKNYIASNGAFETNFPMLRVTKLNDSTYQTMVAIPTNRMLKGNDVIFFQHFVPWKTLTGTVRGGTETIDQAFKQMQIFVSDNERTSMAVPFQLLITDRTAEADTLKWLTMICQPVS